MLSDKFKKDNGPVLDEKTADQMLENIFSACEVEPNSIPLTVLTSYSNYRRERFLLQRILLIIIMVFFCIVPLLFITPDIKLTSTDNHAQNKPSYELVVNSFIAVSRVTATIEGSNVPVYATADRTYSVEPTRNGTMTVTVTLKNKQMTTVTCEVTGADTETPVVVSNHYAEDMISLYLSDTGSGVDYEKIKAIDLDGKEVSPYSYDENEDVVVFAYPEKSLNIYIPDKTGNTLQLILTVK